MIDPGDYPDPSVTFIDVDENKLVLWLQRDRVRLGVIDCRPELEAGELRRFASLLFSTYVAPALAVQLAEVRAQLGDVRAQAGAPGAQDAALDRAGRALDAIDDLLATAVRASGPAPEPPPTPQPPLVYVPLDRRRKRRARGDRAGEPAGPRWSTLDAHGRRSSRRSEA